LEDRRLGSEEAMKVSDREAEKPNRGIYSIPLRLELSSFNLLPYISDP